MKRVVGSGNPTDISCAFWLNPRPSVFLEKLVLELPCKGSSLLNKETLFNTIRFVCLFLAACL